MPQVLDGFTHSEQGLVITPFSWRSLANDNRGLDIGVVCRKAARHHVVRVLQVNYHGK